MKIHTVIWMALSMGAISPLARAQAPSSPTVPVTIDNYNRAQTDKPSALCSKFLTGMKQLVRGCMLLSCSSEQRFQIRAGCTVPTRIRLIL
jgi:hypothetical protein